MLPLSSDGQTVAIGALGSNSEQGQARVFRLNESNEWVQLGQNLDGEAANSWFGSDVSLSSDGNVLAVGANRDDSYVNDSGQVKIFALNQSDQWEQLGQAIDGESSPEYLGGSVSLSADGKVVAIGATHHANKTGKVRVYQLGGDGQWLKIAELDGQAAGDHFGSQVSLSDDGQTMAISAQGNDASGTNAGNVRIFQLKEAIPPVFQSASTSEDGTKVILTYDQDLSSDTAATGDFAVKVDDITVQIGSVSVNGSAVELTLAQAIESDQTVIVDYTDPTPDDDANAIQSLSIGVDADSFSNASVTNETLDTKAPTIDSVYVDSDPPIQENSGAGQILYTPYASESVTYTISGPDADLVSFDASGNITLDVNPDYERIGNDYSGEYRFSLTATDEAGNTSTTEDIVVSIGDEILAAPNLDPSFSTNTNGVLTTIENIDGVDQAVTSNTPVLRGEAPSGATIGILVNGSLIDSSNVVYSGSSWSFDFAGVPLNDGTNEIQYQYTPIDGVAETSSTLSLEIDTTGPVLSSKTDPNAYVVNVPENKGPNYVVHTLTSDESGVTFEKVGGLDGPLFTVASDGTITLHENADYENDQQYQLRVAAIDANGNATEDVVTFNVTDQPVYAPRLRNPATYSDPYDDTSYADWVANGYGIQDGDLINDEQVFVNGKAGRWGSEDVKVYLNQGTENARIIDVDPSARGWWSLTLQPGGSYDNLFQGLNTLYYTYIEGGIESDPSIEVKFYVDSIPPNFSSGSSVLVSTIEENSSDGTLVHAASVDVGDSVTYSLSGTDSDLFDINSSTGEVTVKGLLDKEGSNSGDYSFEVLAEDTAGNVGRQVVSVSVTDQVLATPGLTNIKNAKGFIDTNTPRLTLLSA